MEPEGSLPHSQVPVSCPSLELCKWNVPLNRPHKGKIDIRKEENPERMLRKFYTQNFLQHRIGRITEQVTQQWSQLHIDIICTLLQTLLRSAGHSARTGALINAYKMSIRYPEKNTLARYSCRKYNNIKTKLKQQGRGMLSGFTGLNSVVGFCEHGNGPSRL
jgi:hypothetical protein